MRFENLTAQKINWRGKTEKNFFATYFLVGFANGEMDKPLEVRFYCTDSGVVHCVCWLHLPGVFVHGAAQAGGYGYDKCSTALYEALKKMGVTFDRDEYFAGTGMSHALALLSAALETRLGYKLYTIQAGA